MLIIGREIGQSVIIADEIKVSVLSIESKLRLAIDAPKKYRITRIKQSPGNMGKLKKRARIVGETVQIGNSIKVSILLTESGLIRFAIDAPKEITVFREEIYQKKTTETESLMESNFKFFDYCQPSFA
ncbi:carbon storage regulator [Bacillus sp. BRMEA1]|uniref:carbon storage regulator n=1 Tax=Neobacillus endophyticus TaxID=2738405 RepID=UPI001564E2B8|nr:carbon storage regulator [Neobacillus endophyticus]NRD79379.1 carbon storage regulator [Neobacillus endophyticus]